MATVETTEVKSKSKSKLLIILIVVLLLVLASIITFVVLDKNMVSQIKQILQPSGEYTVLLDEFVVNLKSDGAVKHFLKVKIALMYTEEKQGITIESSVNKIRDVIISNLREKTYKEMLEAENFTTLKKEVIDNLNLAINEDVIKDLYITDIIIQ